MASVLWPSRAAMASRLMPRLMAWVARVCLSWWAVTWPIPAWSLIRSSAVETRSEVTGRLRFDEQQPDRAQPGGAVVGDPVVEQFLQLRVQRDVAVVVEFADRDPKPERRADLDDGVDGEGE